jgi:hypothetical protein
VLAKQLREQDLEHSAHLVSMKEKFPDRQAEPRRVGLLDGPEYLSIRGEARHDNDKADFRYPHHSICPGPEVSKLDFA